MTIEQLLDFKMGDLVWVQWPENLGGQLSKDYTFKEIDNQGYVSLFLPLSKESFIVPSKWMIKPKL